MMLRQLFAAETPICGHLPDCLRPCHASLTDLVALDISPSMELPENSSQPVGFIQQTHVYAYTLVCSGHDYYAVTDSTIQQAMAKKARAGGEGSRDSCTATLLEPKLAASRIIDLALSGLRDYRRTVLGEPLCC